MSGYNKVFPPHFDIIFGIIIFRLENVFWENVILLISCLFSSVLHIYCVFACIVSLDLTSPMIVYALRKEG